MLCLMIDTAHYTAGSAGRTSPYEADRTNRNTEAIRELLFRLGVTAKYKGYFYAIYAVTLCIFVYRGTGTAPIRNKAALPESCQKVQDELEGRGTEYPDGLCSCVVCQPPIVGSTGQQAAGQILIRCGICFCDLERRFDR